MGAGDEARGYLSVESKRQFSIVAGLIGLAGFGLQLLGPFIAMLVMMPVFFASMRNIPDPHSVVVHDGKLVYATHAFEQQATLYALELEDGAQAGELAATDARRPRLLSSNGQLWLVEGGRVGTLEGGRVQMAAAGRDVATASAPFVLDGRPAAVDWSEPDGLSLWVLHEGRWQQRGAFALESPLYEIPDHYQVLVHGDALILVAELGDFLRAVELDEAGTLAPVDAWQTIARDAAGWRGATVNGVATVFWYARARDGTRSELKAARLEGGGWSLYPSTSVYPTGGLGVAVTPEQHVVLLVGNMPGRTRWLEMTDGQVVRRGASGGASFFGMMQWMWLPQLVLPLTSLIIALLLSVSMRQHRVTHYELEDMRVEHASVLRRAVAQLLDGSVLVLPVAVFGSVYFSRLEDVMEGDTSPAAFFDTMGTIALVSAGIALAALATLVLFAFMEGRWGVTPGKWVAGIRVVGTDLRPCGFWRAILRNLLKVVDGFFNFLIGLLLVAFTENWQRLGDMAARTIVIRSARHPPHASDGSAAPGVSGP